VDSLAMSERNPHVNCRVIRAAIQYSIPSRARQSGETEATAIYLQ